MIVRVNVVLNRTVVVSSLTTTQLHPDLRNTTSTRENRVSDERKCVLRSCNMEMKRQCDGRKQGTVKFIFVVNCCCLGDVYICLTQSRDFVIYK